MYLKPAYSNHWNILQIIDPALICTNSSYSSGNGDINFFVSRLSALLRMLTVQPHLVTDKGYLEHTIKYAINCGVIDQWLFARICGFPPKEGMDVPEDEDRRFKSITEREFRAVHPKK